MKNIKLFAFIILLITAVFAFSSCELLLSILTSGLGSVPDAPTGLSASFNSNTKLIDLKWNAVEGATKYNIFYGNTSSTSSAQYYVSTANNYYSFKPPVSNATLYFWVSASNSYGNSSGSSSASVTINVKYPLIFEVTSKGPDFISIAFSKVSNVSRYYLMIGTSETNLSREDTFYESDFNEDNLVTHKISGLQTFTKYYLQVKIDDNNTTSIINETTNKPYEYFVSEPIFSIDRSYEFEEGMKSRKILYTRINTSATSTLANNNGTYVSSINGTTENEITSRSAVQTSLKTEIEKTVNTILSEKNISFPQDFAPARTPIDELIKNDPKVSRPVTSRANIGTNTEFWIQTANDAKKLRAATVRATGKYCVVYIDDAVYSTSSTSDNDNKITTLQAQAIRDKFDTLYLKMTNIFGELYSEQIDGFIAPQSKVKIYVYDIYEDYSVNQSGGIYGYFWSKDLYPVKTVSYSNEAPMFYIDSFFLDKDTNTMYSTLFHEFQHMLRFMNKNMPLGTAPSADGTWANEMMAMLAEEILQQDLGNEDVHSPKNRLNMFLNGGYLLSGLNTWHETTLTDTSSVLYSYANAYAFGTFLMRNYGGINLVREMASNNKYNLEQITSAVKAMGYYADKNDTQIIEELLLEFSRSLFYTDFAGASGTGIPKLWNTSLNQTVGGYTYTITPILLSDYITISGSSVFAGAVGFSNDPAAIQSLLPYTFQLHVWGEATKDNFIVNFASNGSRNQSEVIYLIVK